MVSDLGASASCFLGLRSRTVVSVLLSYTLVGLQEWVSSLAPPDLEPPLPLPQVLTDLAGAEARVLMLPILLMPQAQAPAPSGRLLGNTQTQA